ncbi:(2Fe-2S)-binding protein [Halobacteriales archaeon SW_10_68_16]|jgi:nitrite reductase/ring-hydroxylating ferredoxin subunit|nr:MAG: (2Fe-2S)-binding protein [Halobacteriales archaeon SW_10_68_16]
MPTRLTSVEDVAADPPYLFTVADARGDAEEVIVVPCEDGVEAWVNRCTHEAQRLERGHGASLRDGEIVCPKHGSLFDACAGDCDNGPAAETTLLAVEVTVNRGDVFLTDDDYEFRHEGGIDGGDDPSSTSHLRL